MMIVLGQHKEKLEGRNLWYKALCPSTTDSGDGDRKGDCWDPQGTAESQGKIGCEV